MKPIRIGVQIGETAAHYYIIDDSGYRLFHIQLYSSDKRELLGRTEAEHRREVCERIMYCTLAAAGFDPIFIKL